VSGRLLPVRTGGGSQSTTYLEADTLALEPDGTARLTTVWFSQYSHGIYRVAAQDVGRWVQQGRTVRLTWHHAETGYIATQEAALPQAERLESPCFFGPLAERCTLIAPDTLARYAFLYARLP
jgi:hypothetical protein